MWSKVFSSQKEVKNGLNSTVKLDLPPQNNQAHANSKMLITNAINIFQRNLEIC